MRSTFTYFKGLSPITDKDVRRQQKRQARKKPIDANQKIQICLNCTKPAKKCNGECEYFKER